MQLPTLERHGRSASRAAWNKRPCVARRSPGHTPRKLIMVLGSNPPPPTTHRHRMLRWRTFQDLGHTGSGHAEPASEIGPSGAPTRR